MYLTGWDMAGIMIALVVSLTLIVTTAIANARLTRSRDAWRKGYYDVTTIAKRLIADAETHASHCACSECD